MKAWSIFMMIVDVLIMIACAARLALYVWG